MLVLHYQGTEADNTNDDHYTAAFGVMNQILNEPLLKFRMKYLNLKPSFLV